MDRVKAETKKKNQQKGWGIENDTVLGPVPTLHLMRFYYTINPKHRHPGGFVLTVW